MGADSTLIAITTWLLLLLGRADGAATCGTDSTCQEKYGAASRCRADGKCTVPKLHQGCLQSILPEWTSKRVCNSEDPPDAEERGLCNPPDLPYTEIRLYAGNWESRTFQAWVVQIILSELLGVPTSIEGGTPEATLNFYDSSKPLNYGNFSYLDNAGSYDRANALWDCTKAKKDPEHYEGCAHVALELWGGESAEKRERYATGNFEASTFTGMMGQEAVFVTKYTLDNDTSLGNYLGLQGEDKRQKLAEIFLRPTTWKDYCGQVSPNNCSSDDGTAKRYPQSDVEADRMFVEGVYTGHFRATEENDCSLNNETFQCTGHIGDYPCGWTSALEPQMYHLGIPLQSSGSQPNSRGYTYQQMVDMWDAANATKSNLMMVWWSPEPLYHRFIGTEAEMISVTFPVPTQECLDNRVSAANTCHESKEVRVGSPLGACDNAPVGLLKVLVSSLREISNNPDDPIAIHSPAYETLRLFQFSEYQLGQVSKLLETVPSSRQAVCHWAAENFDFLQSFVPATYPRTIEEDDTNGMTYATTIVAAVVGFFVLLTACAIHKDRNEEAIKLAQTEFLFLLLAGSLFISVGAILTSLKPNDFTCTAAIWFINIGYTLELVPLIIKVAAICRIIQAAQRLRRAVLKREKLYGAVATILFVVVVYLCIWTGVDPPEQKVEYSLTSETKESGETVILTSYYCSSESDVWRYIAVGWNVVLLSIASIWAFQMRQTHRKLNESATLAFMIYSHFVFVVLRVVTFVLSGHISEHVLRQARSLIYSVDTITTILIYFVPKLAAGKEIQKKVLVVRRTFSHHTSKHAPKTTPTGRSACVPANQEAIEEDESILDEDKGVSNSLDQGKGVAYIKVNKAAVQFVRDVLVSYQEVEPDASADVVVERSLGIIKRMPFPACQDGDKAVLENGEAVALIEKRHSNLGDETALLDASVRVINPIDNIDSSAKSKGIDECRGSGAFLVAPSGASVATAAAVTEDNKQGAANKATQPDLEAPVQRQTRGNVTVDLCAVQAAEDDLLAQKAAVLRLSK